jgi:hypothetical protein
MAIRIPLNSKRLTGARLRRLVRSLSLAETGSVDEIRQVIEGHLTTVGKEPANVQVAVRTDENDSSKEILELHDDSGIFHIVEESREVVKDEDEEETMSISVCGSGEDVDRLREENEELRRQLEEVRIELENETKRKELWKISCEQIREYDELLTAKDDEIDRLKFTKFEEYEKRKGKAPPVDSFTGEEPSMQLDDWLPMLQRAASWNGWSEGEQLIQFAGHLRGRALVEWNLLSPEETVTYEEAVLALRARLEPGGKAMAGQDFRHCRQRPGELVADFIRRVERTFQVAYGRDTMSRETKDALQHGQLQEGLLQEILQGPAVSGAQTYKELCAAAKIEEKRLEELRKRQRYQRSGVNGGVRNTQPSEMQQPRYKPVRREERRCHNCSKVGHIARDCRVKPTESGGRYTPGAAVR